MKNKYEPLLEELKRKKPALAKRAEKSPLAAIRLECLCCTGDSTEEVKNCTAETTCALWGMRMGKLPGKRKKMTEKQKEIARNRLKKARKENESKK